MIRDFNSEKQNKLHIHDITPLLKGQHLHWLLKTVVECFAKARMHREAQLLFLVHLDFLSGTLLLFLVHELSF